ncbi:MAG: hypothetical protein IPO27_02200 [Bacteroidetes bacterium]|nr:hypothetical protein [Bacteroidota bacterium]
MATSLFKQVAAYQGHKGGVYGLAVNTLQQKIYTAGSDSFIVEWDLDGTDGKLIARANGIVYRLSYINAGHLLLAGNSLGGVHVIDTKNNAEIRLLKPFEKEIFCIAWFQETETCAVASADGQVIFYNRQFEPLAHIRISNAKIRSMVYHAGTQLYYAGTAEGKIIAINASRYKVVQEVQAHRPGWSVNCMCVSADNSMLISGGRDAMLNSFDLTTGLTPVLKIPAHNYAIYSVEPSPNKKYLLTASRDKTVKVWDADTMHVIQRLEPVGDKAHSYSINCAAWIDGRHLVCAGDAREIYIFDCAE